MVVQKDIVKAYVRYLKLQRNMSGNTLDAYQRDLRKLLDYLEREQLGVADVTLADLEHFLPVCMILGSIRVRNAAYLVAFAVSLSLCNWMAIVTMILPNSWSRLRLATTCQRCSLLPRWTDWKLASTYPSGRGIAIALSSRCSSRVDCV